ncbi:MAG: hydrogenase maturation protease [Theionarchaea archaeon]|nr:hydrogenase maturation protease [Theionarchaea archaeon]
MKILILGIGNPILTDDAVGILVARQLHDNGIDVEELAVGGLSLLDYMVGYDKVIVIDAVKRNEANNRSPGGEDTEREIIPPGTVSVLRPHEIERALHASCIHDVSFSEALKVGECLFLESMPSEIICVGIEVEDTETFSETPTKAIMAAIPEAVTLVKKIVHDWKSHS